MRLRRHAVAVATTGSAGSASGSKTIRFPEPVRLIGVHIDYDPSAPATTDVTIANLDRNVLVISNNATDIYRPVVENTRDDLGALTPAGDNRWGVVTLFGDVDVDVDGSDTLDPAVTVSLLVESDGWS